jgi:hypothetical protein
METEPFEEWIQIGNIGHFDMVKRPTELLIWCNRSTPAFVAGGHVERNRGSVQMKEQCAPDNKGIP